MALIWEEFRGKNKTQQMNCCLNPVHQFQHNTQLHTSTVGSKEQHTFDGFLSKTAAAATAILVTDSALLLSLSHPWRASIHPPHFHPLILSLSHAHTSCIFQTTSQWCSCVGGRKCSSSKGQRCSTIIVIAVESVLTVNCRTSPLSTKWCSVSGVMA